MTSQPSGGISDAMVAALFWAQRGEPEFRLAKVWPSVASAKVQAETYQASGKAPALVWQRVRVGAEPAWEADGGAVRYRIQVVMCRQPTGPVAAASLCSELAVALRSAQDVLAAHHPAAGEPCPVCHRQQDTIITFRWALDRAKALRAAG